MRVRAVQSLLLPCVLLAAYSHPQEVAKSGTTGHPKLGLVLEGGGALGLAHIGVLQWMEEHRIQLTKEAVMAIKREYPHSLSVDRNAWLPGVQTNCSLTSISWANLGIFASS
jgi:hypothetical protein